MGLLDQTRNFIALSCAAADYLPAWRGYHEWAAFSTLSAIAAPRVNFKSIRTEALRPTLYTFLVGPPGAGKGHAINFSLALLTELERKLNRTLVHIPEKSRPALVPDLVGNITMPAMWKVLEQAHRRAEKPEAPAFLRELPPQLWYTCDELAQALDAGSPMTRDLLTFLTGTYSDSPRKRGYITKTSGAVRITSPVITWLTGTTMDWLKLAVSHEIIKGGFPSRVVFSVGARPPKRRLIVPAEYDAIVNYLTGRLAMILTTVRGTFTFANAATEDAYYAYRDLYEANAGQEDATIQDATVREDVLLLKLAMLTALADEVDLSGELTIDVGHLAYAHEAVLRARMGTKHVLTYLIAVSRDAESMQWILDIVARSGRNGVYVKELGKLARKQGLTMEQLHLYLRSLAASEEVRLGVAQPGGPFVRLWRGRTLPRETMNGAGSEVD
jgi:hypothetical protein